MEWPLLVRKAGCIIREVYLDGKSKTQVSQKVTIEGLSQGMFDYWATVCCHEARAPLFFLKPPHPSNGATDTREACMIGKEGWLKESEYLVRSLYYLFVASGGVLSTTASAVFRGVHLFRCDLDTHSRILQNMRSRRVAISSIWTATDSDSLHQFDKFYPFSVVHAKYLSDRVIIATGPVGGRQDGLKAFLAISSARRFFASNHGANLIIKLIREAGASQITIDPKEE